MLRLASVFTYPIQGLRIVDTIPWGVVLCCFGRKLRKSELKYSACFIGFIMAAIVMHADAESLLRVMTNLLLFVLYPVYSLKNPKVNVTRFLVVLLFVAALEDLLISFGILSPLVRDPDGALFLFREKSYAALFVLFAISLSVSAIRLREIILLVGVLCFLGSGLLIIGVFFALYSILFNNSSRFFHILPVVTVCVFYTVVYWVGDVLALLPYSDSLRFLINIAAFESHSVGSIFVHHSLEESRFIDLDSSYFADWINLTPQAIFFNLWLFYGWLSLPLIVLEFWLLAKSPLARGQRSLYYMCYLVLTYLVQGFLFNPYIIYYLATGRVRSREKY